MCAIPALISLTVILEQTNILMWRHGFKSDSHAPNRGLSVQGFGFVHLKNVE